MLAAAGGYMSVFRLPEMNAELAGLLRDCEAAGAATNALVRQKRELAGAFAALREYRVSAAGTESDFYSEVVKAMDAPDLVVLSVQKNGAADGRVSVSIGVNGDYYSLMDALVGLREAPVTMSVTRLSVLAVPEEAGQNVRASMTIEAALSEAAQAASSATQGELIPRLYELIRQAAAMRSGSADTVRLMRSMERCAFAVPVSHSAAPVFVAPPPSVVVRAVMNVDGMYTAVLDIDGVGLGIVVRAGDTFLRKRGRILSVSPSGVVISWDGKRYSLNLGGI
jgi:hypothetical protein